MSIPYFSLFIGELPGKPDRLFATAARLRSNAGEAADIHSDVRRSDGFAPNWKGKSAAAFNVSKNVQSEDLAVLSGGLSDGAESLEAFAWILSERKKAVAEQRAILKDYDRQVNEAPDADKKKVYDDLKDSASRIRAEYHNTFKQTEEDATVCAAEMRKHLHIEPLNRNNGTSIGRRTDLSDDDIKRINGQLENPDPNLVNQGSIGDCYYLASLAAIMQTDKGDEWLRSCVKPHYDEAGRQDGYLVTVYDDPLHPDSSASQTVLVTDVYQNGVKGKDGEPSLASIFESAYGQIHPGGTAGSTPNGQGIGSGRSTDAMKDITGEEAKRIDRNEGFIGLFSGYSEEQRTEIGNAAKDHPVVADTNASLPGFDKDGNGKATVTINGQPQTINIVSNHSYTVVSSDNNGVTMRNPWGLNQTDGEDAPAEFTMSWEDFEKYYGDVAIGNYPS